MKSKLKNFVIKIICDLFELLLFLIALSVLALGVAGFSEVIGLAVVKFANIDLNTFWAPAMAPLYPEIAVGFLTLVLVLTAALIPSIIIVGLYRWLKTTWDKC